MREPHTRTDERGSVIFYVLIAVVLLAALSYAVSNSIRGNVQQLSEDRARLYASEILEYANIMANAVAQLRLRGVDDDMLCFDDPNWGADDYDHAGCTDNLNKIFHPSGAGLTWTQPPSEAMDSAASPDNIWHIYGDNEIQDVGETCGDSSCADLILVVDELAQQTCIEINELLDITNPGDVPPTDTDMGETRYIGAFGYSETIGDEAGVANFRGRTSACFQRTAAPAEYVFYKVLIAR